MITEIHVMHYEVKLVFPEESELSVKTTDAKFTAEAFLSVRTKVCVSWMKADPKLRVANEGLCILQCAGNYFYPKRTLLILSRGMPMASSSLLLVAEQSSHLSSACGEHRNCSRGRRYFPQKSTNFICRTLASKYTPLQHGFTQRRALFRYWSKWAGRSCGPYLTPVFFMHRPLNSNNEGGLNAMSLTNRTTRGFSLRLNSSRFRSFTSPTGSSVNLLLCRLKDCKCVSFANVEGSDSILLSHRLRAFNLRSIPSSAGTDASWLPPR